MAFWSYQIVTPLLIDWHPHHCLTGDFEKRFKKVLSKKLVKIAHIARFMLRCGTKWERFTLAPRYPSDSLKNWTNQNNQHRTVYIPVVFETIRLLWWRACRGCAEG